VSTPLGVIVGRAEQLARRLNEDERGLRAANAIQEQADRIGKIVRGFLALARGDATSLEEVEPEDIVRDATELVEHRFTTAHVSLAIEVAPELPAISCEPKLFTQVLVNLLLNACDACEKGGSVAIRALSEEGRIAFIVEDDGHGITRDDLARAKEPFFTTKPPGKGTGLGLAIATEIVSHHCGTLSLEPRSDGARGTVARVEVGSAKRQEES
jgi:signal transduction histidine kinase